MSVLEDRVKRIKPFIQIPGSLDIIVPAHNEGDKLVKAVAVLAGILPNLAEKPGIIIVEDGSTDSTPVIAREIAKHYKNIRLVQSSKRLGKGRALTKGILASKADIVIFVDCDLSPGIESVAKIVQSASCSDITIASRLMRTSSVSRSPKRELLSRAYNAAVRILLGSKLRDHQCGLKAIRQTDETKALIKELQEKGFSWDTELLVKAQLRGLIVAEIPITWCESEGASKVKLRTDVIHMLFGLARIHRSIAINKKSGNPHS